MFSCYRRKPQHLHVFTTAWSFDQRVSAKARSVAVVCYCCSEGAQTLVVASVALYCVSLFQIGGVEVYSGNL